MPPLDAGFEVEMPEPELDPEDVEPCGHLHKGPERGAFADHSADDDDTPLRDH